MEMEKRVFENQKKLKQAILIAYRKAIIEGERLEIAKIIYREAYTEKKPVNKFLNWLSFKVIHFEVYTKSLTISAGLIKNP